MAFPQLNFWSSGWRAVVFFLSASSIWCLLADFYGVCSMRTFTLAIFLPACAVLTALLVADLVRGNRQLTRAIVIGLVSGFAAAIAYDLFRLPFVFARAWGLDSVLPALPLFKVFPIFGALILGEPTGAPSFSAHIVGWIYHFSNGMTFGLMYLAVAGLNGRRVVLGAVAMAVGLEAAMLLTPYTDRFAISVSAAFISVTLAAHLVFGIVLGKSIEWFQRTARFRSVSAPASV